MSDCILYLLILCILGFIGHSIGSSKGRGTSGFWLGFFLGIIGWIIVACLPRKTDNKGSTKCPECGATIGSAYCCKDKWKKFQ